MNEFTGIVVVRCLAVIAGVVLIWLGYRLFAITGRTQGEFRLKHGKDLEVSSAT